MQFVDLPAQYKEYRKEIDEAMSAVVTSSRFIDGSEVKKLEEELASFVGIPHAVGCASGTDALILALMALGIGAGDEVITTPFTFIATAEAIALVGAKPVFADIEPDTYNLDPQLLEKAVHARTKAIITVDIFGLPANYEAIQAIADRHDIFLIEDAAQSLGAEFDGRKCGSFGTLATTSFFPAKPLGCYGDGGMIFSADEKLAERLRIRRNHGQQQRYNHGTLGMNSRLDTLQAAVLLAKLPHFVTEIDRRRQIAASYSESFAPFFQVPVDKPGYFSVYAQYSLRSDRRSQVIETLNKAGIPTAIHYPTPLHLQGVFSELGYQPGDLPVAEQVCEEIFSIPIHPFLSDEDKEKIVSTAIGALR